jgi:hypothetical protein
LYILEIHMYLHVFDVIFRDLKSDLFELTKEKNLCSSGETSTSCKINERNYMLAYFLPQNYYGLT